MYPWSCSVSWCLAEDWKMEISAALWLLWLYKEFTLLFVVSESLQKICLMLYGTGEQAVRLLAVGVWASCWQTAEVRCSHGLGHASLTGDSRTSDICVGYQLDIRWLFIVAVNLLQGWDVRVYLWVLYEMVDSVLLDWRLFCKTRQ